MAIADRITLLNAGVIEQEGAPTELYNEPATLFAAEFMGSNNRLRTGGRAGECGRRDRRAGHRLDGVARSHAAVGAKATGVIRIERMQIGGAPGPNRIPMTLDAQMYLGERWELVFNGRADHAGLCTRAAAARILSRRVSVDRTWVF